MSNPADPTPPQPPRPTGPTAHRLTIAALDRMTDRAYRIGFAVPPSLLEAYAFTAGQHIMINQQVDDRVERRAYSICTTPAELTETAQFSVGVKILPGGRFSQRVRDHLAVGDRLSVTTPTGRFVARRPDEPDRRYAMIAAGSGITPLLSIAADLLQRHLGATIRLTLLNRTPDDVMFADRLDALASAHRGLTVDHVFSRIPDPTGRLGRLDTPGLTDLVRRDLDAATDEWFLCGPQSLIMTARDLVLSAGVSKRVVHHELFWTA